MSDSESSHLHDSTRINSSHLHDSTRINSKSQERAESNRDKGIVELIHVGPLYLCTECKSLIKVIKEETQRVTYHKWITNDNSCVSKYDTYISTGFTCPNCKKFNTFNITTNE